MGQAFGYWLDPTVHCVVVIYLDVPILLGAIMRAVVSARATCWWKPRPRHHVGGTKAILAAHCGGHPDQRRPAAMSEADANWFVFLPTSTTCYSSLQL